MLKKLVWLTRNRCTSAKMKMKMALVKLCKDLDAAKIAADYLSEGQVIAVPTDTVYGLACSANCQKAIQQLYAIKGRDSIKPVAICVTRISDLRKWGISDHLSDELLQELLPGPITIVLKKTKLLDNPFLNPHTSKIGIRIPNHLFINNVTNLFDMPVALTSANSSNEPSTLSVTEFEHLYSKLGVVFDGGLLNDGKDKNRTGSTVVDLSTLGVYHLVRKGISCNDIVTVLERYGWLPAK